MEDEGVNCSEQDPPAGNKDKYTTSIGKKIVRIVPHFCECPGKDEYTNTVNLFTIQLLFQFLNTKTIY
jgi:hypothetical protein